MRTSEIRDKLLAERALYQQSVQNSNAAIEKIQSIINDISEEDIALLRGIGVEVNHVCNFNLERMKQDNEYLTKCEELLFNIIEAIRGHLERELGV